MFLPQQALIGKPGTWTYYQVLERLHTKARSTRFCMIVYFRFCTGVLPGAQVPGTVVKRSLGTWPYSVDLACLIVVQNDNSFWSALALPGTWYSVDLMRIVFDLQSLLHRTGRLFIVVVVDVPGSHAAHVACCLLLVVLVFSCRLGVLLICFPPSFFTDDMMPCSKCKGQRRHHWLRLRCGCWGVVVECCCGQLRKVSSKVSSTMRWLPISHNSCCPWWS